MSKVRPLSISQDAGKGYVPPAHLLGFAVNWDVIPVSSGELGRLIGWYPVGFYKKDDSYHLGMPSRSGEMRALINPLTGKWFGHYLPMALRVYPFQVVNAAPESGLSPKPMLGIDTIAEAHFTTESERPVLDDQGELTDVGKKRLQALQRFQKRRDLDQEVIKLLQERNAFEPWSLNMGTEDVPAEIDNWYQINATCIRDLIAQDVVELHTLDGWNLIYGHLYSKLRSFAPSKIAARLSKRQAMQQSDSLDFLLGEDGDQYIDFELYNQDS